MSDPVPLPVVRVWRYPSEVERITWSEVYRRVRDLPGAESSVIVPEGRIETIVAAAVAGLAQFSYRSEEWYATLTEEPVDGIPLPWSPTGIVRCSLASGTTGQTAGQDVSIGMYEVMGTSWRWLGPPGTWPEGVVRWSLWVTGTPVDAEVEPVASTVPWAVLRPLLELELAAVLDLAEGRRASEVLTILNQGRASALKLLKVPQRPPTLVQSSDGAGGVSAAGWIVFRTWSDDAYTWEDLP